eukprot:TRINITY_DN1001_c0_g1_i3.p1 TRINITY_DN1001_c0_g1~~TRINITY_DN1001_c0_g1_i3.p1  ORF type:complete len:277 (-),score=23.58 TRINITY_DN1001_c0_g1_i3:104-934(-)
MTSVLEVQGAASSAFLDQQRLTGMVVNTNKILNSKDNADVHSKDLIKRAKIAVQKYHDEERILKSVQSKSGEWGNYEKNVMLKEIDMAKEVFKAELEELVDQLRYAAKQNIDQVQDAYKQHLDQIQQQQEVPQEAAEKAQAIRALIEQERARLDTLEKTVIQQVKRSLPWTDYEQSIAQIQMDQINEQLSIFQSEIIQKRQHIIATKENITGKIDYQYRVRTDGLQDLRNRLGDLGASLDGIKQEIGKVAERMNVRVYQSGSRVSRYSQASFYNDS